MWCRATSPMPVVLLNTGQRHVVEPWLTWQRHNDEVEYWCNRRLNRDQHSDCTERCKRSCNEWLTSSYSCWIRWYFVITTLCCLFVCLSVCLSALLCLHSPSMVARYWFFSYGKPFNLRAYYYRLHCISVVHNVGVNFYHRSACIKLLYWNNHKYN